VSRANDEERWVRAEAGGNSATVTIRPSELTVSSTAGDRRVCSAGHLTKVYNTAVAADAQDTDCFLNFRKSSAGQPGRAYRVTGALRWAVAFDSEPPIAWPEALPPSADVRETISVPVAEIQSVVDDAG
jgi:hypothetical protein